MKKLINNYNLDYAKKEIYYLMNFKWKSAESYCPMKTNKSEKIKNAFKNKTTVASSETLSKTLSHSSKIFLKLLWYL